VPTTASHGEAGDGFATRITPTCLKSAEHPSVCIFHLIFKFGALISFLFGGFFGDYITTFVITALVLAVDFWTVKNVTGRLLVGMRWSNEIKDDGSSEWIFESRQKDNLRNPTDSNIFWAGLYLWPIVWIIFFVAYVITFKWDWLLLICLALHSLYRTYLDSGSAQETKHRNSSSGRKARLPGSSSRKYNIFTFFTLHTPLYPF